MKWVKLFEYLPENQNAHEPCFSLADMLDCYAYAHSLAKDNYTMKDYFKEKFNIDITYEAKVLQSDG